MTDDKLPLEQKGVSEIIDELLAKLAAATHADEDSAEYWFARELSALLGYKRWENFAAAIKRAKAACANVGEDVQDHFRDITKMVSIGSGAERPQKDFELTRFACYLIALNGDPEKPEIAAAQTYFALQTRRQEISDLANAEAPELNEDEKRVLLRDELKAHNRALASAAKAAGVVQPLDYAIFQNEGYKGLYGGLDRSGIQRRKHLGAKQDILDHMPSGEMAANLFRATQTEEKLQREGIKNKSLANRAHYEVARKVRQTIADIGGTMPEGYPAVEHVKEARKRVKSAPAPKAITKKD